MIDPIHYVVPGSAIDASLFNKPSIPNEIDRLRIERDELVAALRQAVEVCKAWHGEPVWDIYYKHSPEMRLIREALAKVTK